MLKSVSFGILTTMVMMNASEGAVQFDVKWVLMEHNIQPVDQIIRTNNSEGFTLNGQQLIFFSGGGKYKTTGGFNQTFESVNNAGRHYFTSYGLRKNKITITAKHSGSIALITIQTNGDNSCAARMIYRRLPGQRNFLTTNLSNETVGYSSQMQAENVVCIMKLVPNQ